MKQEDKLKEETEFWLTYIKDWKTNHDEPLPERALTLLDNAQLKLKNHYSEKNWAKPTIFSFPCAGVGMQWVTRCVTERRAFLYGFPRRPWEPDQNNCSICLQKEQYRYPVKYANIVI